MHFVYACTNLTDLVIRIVCTTLLKAIPDKSIYTVCINVVSAIQNKNQNLLSC